MSDRFPDEICRRFYLLEAELIWTGELERKIDIIKTYMRPRVRLTTTTVIMKAYTVWSVEPEPFSFYFEMDNYLQMWVRNNTRTTEQNRVLNRLIRDLIIYLLRRFQYPNDLRLRVV
jgi:hypothetical protein